MEFNESWALDSGCNTSLLKLIPGMAHPDITTLLMECGWIELLGELRIIQLAEIMIIAKVTM